MNHFTKEELAQIVTWATTDVDLNPSKLEVSLFEKIQSMLENYCDHELKIFNSFKDICIKFQRIF